MSKKSYTTIGSSAVHSISSFESYRSIQAQNFVIREWI